MAKAVVQGGNPLENIHTFDGATTGDNIQSSVLVKEGTDTPLPSDIGRGLRVDIAGTTLGDSRVVIATPGVPIQFAGGASTPCKAVTLTPFPLNVSRIAVGGASSDASDLGFRGTVFLEPGSGTISIAVNNVNACYFDGLTANDGCAVGVIV